MCWLNYAKTLSEPNNKTEACLEKLTKLLLLISFIITKHVKNITDKNFIYSVYINQAKLINLSFNIVNF